MRLTVLELAATKMKFAAGHFTMFSANSREPLHGHNYNVKAAITAEIDEGGITFNYAIYKNQLIDLCKQLNSYFILPQNSPYLRIETLPDYYHVYFAEEMIPFLKKDVVLLPIKNGTLEELSFWFLQQLVKDRTALEQYRIHQLDIRVFNGLGQSANAVWSR